ncbi:MAG: hypothetical protein KDD40_11865, partial [Bdellovibrionales bacterium]|nr:hypothetical protein [Bdellovibrionales bacterium]
MRIVFLALLVMFYFIKTHAEECIVKGQYVVAKYEKGYSVLECSLDKGGILTPQPLKRDDLLMAIDLLKNDELFIETLNSFGIGRDFKTARENIAKKSGLIKISDNDPTFLSVISQKMNDVYKVNTNANKKKNLVEAKMTIKDLESANSINSRFIKELRSSNCYYFDKDSSVYLRAYTVWFKDGTKAILLPFEGKELEKDVYQFMTPNFDNGTQLRINNREKKQRKLKFEKGKVLWFSEGIWYPVDKFTTLEPEDVIRQFPSVETSEDANMCYFK